MTTAFPSQALIDQLSRSFYDRRPSDKVCVDALNRAHEHVARRFWRDILPNEPRPNGWFAAVFAVAAVDINLMLGMPHGYAAEQNADQAVRRLQKEIAMSQNLFTARQWISPVPITVAIWALAVRSVDCKTDSYVEPTIGQMIHFQTVASELGKEADPQFEHGGLTGFGRDAFRWFFDRPCKSDFTAQEVKAAWARHDIHNGRVRRRILGDDWAHKHNNAYAFLRVCAAHGLMIRIEAEGDKGRLSGATDKNPIFDGAIYGTTIMSTPRSIGKSVWADYRDIFKDSKS